MKALVVGGTGFIGSHIVQNLLSKEIEVRVLIQRKRNISSLSHEKIEYVYGDILDVNSLRKCSRDIELVYSAFGVLGQWGIPEKTYWEVNYKGVKNLLVSCLDIDIRQFIHISSAGVLGPLPDGIIADESFPLNPSNVYERTKSEAEKEILKYGEKYRIPLTIIRPEFVYGPGDTHVIGLFRAIQARRFFLLGNGKSLLHPTYIDDLVHALSLCIDNEKAIGQIYLITGESPLSVQELAKIMAEELNIGLPKMRIPLILANSAANILELGGKMLGFEPALTRSRVKFFSENRAFGCNKARSELGYSPQVDFREGVRRTIRWYRERGYL